ncbi:hepatic and glial cell adhesion molecule [Heterodontus francisci]|uniref:hepatic and glial cell adhesion molecule n=1 Tax=Heterodontus francisci TaxID=7792 RepID=UPI00355B36CF
MGCLSKIIGAMLQSQSYLTSFIILLLGHLQGASAQTKLVTGFLHQPICLAVEGNRNESSLVQTISWHRGIQSIVQYQNTAHSTVKIFPKYEGRITYIAENNSLLIHQLSLLDESTYMITTTLNSGLEIHKFINLTVLVPVSEPSITVQTEDAPYPKLTMNCTVKSGSNPQFSWMKDDQILPVDQQFQLSTDRRSLGVSNLTSSDCGTYSCIIQNPVNRVEAQQLITDDHFQDCVRLPTVGPEQHLGTTVAMFCVVGFLVVFLVVFLAIKKYKERQRGLRLREQLNGEEDLFREDKVQNEQSQTNMSSLRDGPQSCQYTYLHFIPRSGSQEEEKDQSGYCTIGPRL